MVQMLGGNQMLVAEFRVSSLLARHHVRATDTFLLAQIFINSWSGGDVCHTRPIETAALTGEVPIPYSTCRVNARQIGVQGLLPSSRPSVQNQGIVAGSFPRTSSLDVTFACARPASEQSPGRSRYLLR